MFEDGDKGRRRLTGEGWLHRSVGQYIRQDKTRQDKTGQDRTSQDKTRQDKTRWKRVTA